MAPERIAAIPATSGSATADRVRRPRSRSPTGPARTRRRGAAGSLATSGGSSRSRHRVDGEALRVLLGIGRVEGHAVEERFLLRVVPRRLDAHVLGHLTEEVGAMHAVDEALVVGRLLDHAPAPELGEPPDAMRLEREVRLPVEEGHVVLVLLTAPVAVVVVAEHAAEDDLLRGIDVLRLADDLRHPRTVLELVVPLTGFQHG